MDLWSIRLMRNTIACLFAAASIWAAWPMLSLASYPNVPARAYLGMLLMAVAKATVKGRARSAGV